MKKLKQAIEKELKELVKTRQSIKEFSMLGNNNWESLDREIILFNNILKSKNIIEALDDAIYDTEDQIEEIENNYGEDDLDNMLTEKEPYENLLETLKDLKQGVI